MGRKKILSALHKKGYFFSNESLSFDNSGFTPIMEGPSYGWYLESDDTYDVPSSDEWLGRTYQEALQTISQWPDWTTYKIQDRLHDRIRDKGYWVPHEAIIYTDAWYIDKTYKIPNHFLGLTFKEAIRTIRRWSNNETKNRG
jgi:hypothetical protein